MHQTHLNSVEIWLAPLRGCTDAVFRNVYHAFYHGLDGALAPFLTTFKGSRVKPSHIKDVLPERNCNLCIVPQILSKTADPFIVLAQCLFDLGYPTINWNMGCPYPMVAGKGRGAGLLPQPGIVTAFLDTVMARIPNRLSIKLRLGYHRPDEIHALFPILNQYPLEELIIHPRTGKQMYDGVPDEAAFMGCLAQTSHRIVYNGDIRTREDIQRLRRKFPTVNKWMIGRGIVVDPFLPARIKNNALGNIEKLEKFERFHTALVKGYRLELNGPGHLLNRMKGLWRYFSQGFQQGRHHIKKIHKSRTFSAYQGHVDALFAAERQMYTENPLEF